MGRKITCASEITIYWTLDFFSGVIHRSTSNNMAPLYSTVCRTNYNKSGITGTNLALMRIFEEYPMSSIRPVSDWSWKACPETPAAIVRFFNLFWGGFPDILQKASRQ